MMYLRHNSGAVMYRWYQVNWNDGTQGRMLQYYSGDFETWRFTNERNPEQFAKDRLINWDLS